MRRSAPRPARKPYLSPAFVSAVLASHSALGLAFAALIYIICLSGTLAVFMQELERWEQPSAPRVAAVEPEAIQRGIVAIRARAPTQAKESVSVHLPSPETPRFILSAGGREGVGAAAWLADGSGRPTVKVHKPFSAFLVSLHAGLHLPEGLGSTLVGLTGVALLALLISGVLAHPRMIKDAFVLRRGGSRRLQEADLHNRLGTWGLPFHITVTLTGAVLGLFFVIFGSLAATAYKGDMPRALNDLFGLSSLERKPEPAAIPAIAPMLARVRIAAPSASIQAVSIQQPGTQGQTVTILVQAPRRLALFERYAFDGKGKMTYAAASSAPSVAKQIGAAIQPLHFGWFGGIFVKLAYGVLGLSLCAMTSGGIRIWLARRRDKGRPAPVWERFWTATVWGQPIALLLAAALPLLWSHEAAAEVGWAAGAAIAYGGACWLRDERSLAGSLRAATAALLLGLALGHASCWSWRMADHAGWIVDGVLVVGAVILVLMLRREAKAIGRVHCLKELAQ